MFRIEELNFIRKVTGYCANLKTATKEAREQATTVYNKCNYLLSSIIHNIPTECTYRNSTLTYALDVAARIYKLIDVAPPDNDDWISLPCAGIRHSNSYPGGTGSFLRIGNGAGPALVLLEQKVSSVSPVNRFAARIENIQYSKHITSYYGNSNDKLFLIEMTKMFNSGSGNGVDEEPILIAVSGDDLEMLKINIDYLCKQRTDAVLEEVKEVPDVDGSVSNGE